MALLIGEMYIGRSVFPHGKWLLLPSKSVPWQLNMFEHWNQTIFQLLQLSVGVGQTVKLAWEDLSETRTEQVVLSRYHASAQLRAAMCVAVAPKIAPKIAPQWPNSPMAFGIDHHLRLRSCVTWLGISRGRSLVVICGQARWLGKSAMRSPTPHAFTNSRAKCVIAWCSHWDPACNICNSNEILSPANTVISPLFTSASGIEWEWMRDALKEMQTVSPEVPGIFVLSCPLISQSLRLKNTEEESLRTIFLASCNASCIFRYLPSWFVF